MIIAPGWKLSLNVYTGQLDKKLGISHTWLQKLVRQFQADPTVMCRDVRRCGNPTYDELIRVSERTRQLRENGGLRGSRLPLIAKFIARND